MNLKKIFAYIFILLLLANMVLFAFKLISGTLFWTIIAVIGLISYFGFRKK